MRRIYSLHQASSNVHHRQRGLTLIEPLICLFAFTVLFAIAFPLIQNTPTAVATRKLESDVRTVNAAIDVFRVFGGEVDSVSVPGDILRKLQSQADALTAEQTLGLSSSFIDRRLKAVMQTSAQEQTDAPRAVWNSEKRRFVVKSSGAGGVAEFVLDHSLPAMPALVDSRTPNMRISTENGWIWEYSDRDASGGLVPTDVFSGSFADAGPGGSGGGGAGGGSGGSGGSEAGGPGSSPDAVALDPPGFSKAGGEYPVTDFNLLLELSNPNSAGVSRIVYRVNSGAWMAYVDLPVPIGVDTVITAYCETIDEEWLNSEEISHTYTAEPVKLKKPKVKNNNGHGNNVDGVDVSNPGAGDGGPNGEDDPSGDIDDEKKWVEVYLESENDSETEELEYRVNGGVWKAYNGNFYLFQEDYPLGVIVDARAQSIELYYEDSDEDRDRLEWLDPVPFDHPGLSTDVNSFAGDPTAQVVATIVNPNDLTLSAVKYRIEGGSWQDYSGPVTLNANDYNGDPSVLLEAKIVGTVTQEIDGETLSLNDSGMSFVTIDNP